MRVGEITRVWFPRSSRWILTFIYSRDPQPQSVAQCWSVAWARPRSQDRPSAPPPACTHTRTACLRLRVHSSMPVWAPHHCLCMRTCLDKRYAPVCACILVHARPDKHRTAICACAWAGKRMHELWHLHGCACAHARDREGESSCSHMRTSAGVSPPSPACPRTEKGWGLLIYRINAMVAFLSYFEF